MLSIVTMIGVGVSIDYSLFVLRGPRPGWSARGVVVHDPFGQQGEYPKGVISESPGSQALLCAFVPRTVPRPS
jgi:hypothetical protein